MTTFAQAVADQSARTENQMKAFKDTGDSVVSLFYNIGASRGKDIIPDFVKAFVEDQELALRVAQWARDIRGGAGERKLFRDILKFLETNAPDAAEKLLGKIPEIGRWDDIFVFTSPRLKNQAYTMLGNALREGNALAAKWSPRKGPIAAELRTFFGMSPRHYRKTLVNLTQVVETNMCSNDWDTINFSHVPSVAASRYKKAFNRHTPKYAKYVAALKRGDTSVKVNAGAVYPYDVLKGVDRGTFDDNNFTQVEIDHIVAQWDALPNYIGNANVLPLVDVSGSMLSPVGSTSCLDVAVSLGLYFSEKNKGPFKDVFLTFSTKSELVTLKGNVVQRMQQMVSSDWTMSTNLHSALDKILQVATEAAVEQEHMPEMLLILSDMQFDSCVKFDDTAYQMIQRKYTEAGYQIPKIVFWNLNSYRNVPVQAHSSGVALVSGFSPSIMDSILSGNSDNFTPRAIMMQAIMKPRYDI